MATIKPSSKLPSSRMKDFSSVLDHHNMAVGKANVKPNNLAHLVLGMHPMLQERELQTAFRTSKSNTFRRPSSGIKQGAGKLTAMSTHRLDDVIKGSPGKLDSSQN